MEIVLECLDEVDEQAFLLESPELSVAQPGFVIGRARDCHLQLANSFVSRHHCELIPDEERHALRVRDLGSQNGTYVNDSRVKPEGELHDGDRLTVGCVPFEIHID